MGLTLVTPPATDPITLGEAQAHCRIDNADSDGLLAGYIIAARQHLEEVCSRAFITQTWDYTIDHDWPWYIDLDTNRHERLIELMKAPLQSVTSISYVDGAGDPQTLAGSQYVFEGARTIGHIYPAYGVTWPQVRCQKQAITVRFVAGYGSNPGDVPEPLRQAMLLLIGQFYEHREEVVTGTTVSEIPKAVDALIAPFRVYY